MDNAKCRTLIHLYRGENFLWNSKNPNYYNKSLREDAWKKIGDKMNKPIDVLKQKMTNLLAGYRREKSRMKRSYATGSDRDDIYVSKWFAFRDFEFMSDRNLPNETSETLSDDDIQILPEPENQENENDIVKQEYLKDISEQEDNNQKETNIQQEPSNSIAHKRVRHKPALRAKKARKDEKTQERMIQEAFQILQSSTADPKDAYFSYGQHVANELRKYDPQTLSHVKHAINNIIFEADIGKYTFELPSSSGLNGLR